MRYPDILWLVWAAFPGAVAATDFSGTYQLHRSGTLVVTGTQSGTVTELIERDETMTVGTDGSVSAPTGGVVGTVDAGGQLRATINGERKSQFGPVVTSACTATGKLVAAGTGITGNGTYSCSFSASYLSESGTWSVTRTTTPTTTPTPVLTPTPLPDPATLTVGNGLLPAASITVNVGGSLESRTVVADLLIADLLSVPAQQAFAANLYQVFVIALVPGERIARPVGQPALFAKTAVPSWNEVSGPLPAFMQNVAASSQDQRVRLEILRDTNLGTLLGTEFYIGYGLSDAEMLENRRYRGIYKVTATTP